MTDLTLPVNFVKPDPVLTNKIITHLKSKGIFDQFRKECVADVDTKPAYQNLRQRVDGSVAAFLKKNPWTPDMNKNLMREKLRQHIQSGGFLELGVDRIVDQVVNPKIYRQFLPKVQEVVHNYLHIDKDGKPVFDAPPSPKEEDQAESMKPDKPIPGSIPSFAGATKNVPMFIKPAAPKVEEKKPPESEGEDEKDGLQGSDSPDIEEEITAEAEPSENTYIMDDDNGEDNVEGEADDDDEESPPFEPHTEGDRMILGVRTDSSDNSNDSQLQTTIVDETTIIDEELEEKIVCERTSPVKEEASEEEKKEESSSDEYVPKTPTINMEASDGSLIEFDTISEYKQYQTKYDEETFGNVEEEVVACQWDETSMTEKDRNDSSKEEDSECNSRKRKNTETFDEASNSSLDKGSTSDEGKSEMYDYSPPKKPKTDESEHENDTVSEIDHVTIDEEKSLDSKSFSDKELKDRHKSSSSTGSKESGGSRHGQKDRERSGHHSTSSKDKSSKDASSHSSRDRKDSHRRNDKHEHSKDRNRDKDKKKGESSSSSRHDKESKSKPDDKLKDEDKNKHEKDGMDIDKKESRYEHRDKSRDHHEKEKKKHDSRGKHLDGKMEHHESHRHEKDKKENTKSFSHSHSSSRHSHRSYSEKHKSKSERSHKDSSDKHHKTSHEKKSDKDKERKKQREHCKSEDKFEGRRSSDRDSNGPSGRSNISSISKTSSSRGTHSKPQMESEERTTSNSDNTVSDNVETLRDVKSGKNWKLRLNAGPNDDSRSKTNISILESIHSTIELVKSDSSNDIEIIDESCHPVQSSFENSDYSYQEAAIDPPPSIQDTSSEKENIDQTNPGDTTVKFKKPKIAANIHEVRKIMQARRHMKRMEKKRLKLLKKTHSEESDDSTSPSETNFDDQESAFHGFDEAPSLEKIEKYASMISRLSNEIEALDKIEIDPNLITSWIELSPDLDDYIENVLHGKVHRKTRVRLPPISDKHYHYDPVLNVYHLIQTEDSTDGGVLTNNSLNSISNKSPSPVSKSRNSSSSEDSIDFNQSLKRSPTFNGSNLIHVVEVSPDKDSDTDKSLGEMNEVAHKSLLVDDIPDILTMPKTMFNVTFNETYDEILKEQDPTSVSKQSDDEVSKEQDQTPASKQLEEIIQKNHHTIVKITHNKTSEEIVVKKIVRNMDVMSPISKSDALNGSVKSIPLRKLPLISKVNKTKKSVLASVVGPTKPPHLNGIVSPDSTTHNEMAESDKIPLQMINDVIGIPHVGRTGDKAKAKSPPKTMKNVFKTLQKTVNQNSPPESCTERILPRVRQGGGRVQRYDSSDLYKPRPQLTSRRRAQIIIEESSPSSLSSRTKTRKRPMSAVAESHTQPKRKR